MGRLASELLGYDPKHKVSVSTLPKFVPKKAGGGRATPLVIREVAAGPSRAVRDEGMISPTLLLQWTNTQGMSLSPLSQRRSS